MPQSSASLRCSPPLGAGPVHASKVERGPSVRKAAPPISADDAEQDDRPTQRVIPVAQREPRPENTGTIVASTGAVDAYGPGAKWLGRYANPVAAQRRLDLFFGRPGRVAHTLPRGDDCKTRRADQPDERPSAADQGRKPEGAGR
jgi:hypothetical protein